MYETDDRPGLNWADRRTLLQCVAISFAMALLVLTVPVFMLQLYDRIIPSGNVDTLWVLTALALMLLALFGFFDRLRGRLLTRLGTALELRFLAAFPLAARKDGDLERVRAAAQSSAPSALMDLPGIPVFLLVLALLHPWLAALAVSSAVLLGLVSFIFMPRRAESRARDLPFEQLVEGVGSHCNSLIESAALERCNSRRGQQSLRDLRFLDRKQSVAATLKSLRFSAQIGCLALGGFLAMHNLLNAAAIVAATIVMSRALAPIEQLAVSWPLLFEASRAYARLRSLPDENREKNSILLEDGNDLRLRNLAVCPPGEDYPVLRQVDLRLLPGNVLGVVGAGGSGKSCLLRTIAGHWPPRLGQVQLGGIDPAALTPFRRSPLVALVEQNSTLLSGTIAENIASFRKDADASQIVAAAKSAGIHRSILAESGGYGRQVGEGGRAVTAAVRVGVALAAALYDDPAILLLDSPFSGLDIAASAHLKAVLAAWVRAERILVLTSHRLDDVRMAGHLIVLADGRIQAGGAHNDVIAWLQDRQPAGVAAGAVKRLSAKR